MAPPKPLPAWFVPLTRYKYGLLPAQPAHPKPSPAWVLEQWHQFDLWNAWRSHGGKRPPVWTTVPTWAWNLRAELLKKPPPPPPPPPSKWPTVQSKTAGKNGLYYYNLWNVDEAIAQAKAHGLWIAILVNETDMTPQREGARIPEGEIFAIRDRIKGAGVTCVATGWAEPFGDLHAQAQFIGHMAQGFDEYGLNIEVGWAYESGIAAFSKSDEFAPLLRSALGPNMPLSICPDWGNNIHWKPWIQVGLSAVRVQCYLNEWAHKSPKTGMALLGRDQADLPGGIPVLMREVVYGKYGAHNQPLSTWTAYDDEAGQPPRAVWAAEYADAADAAWLAR